MHVQNSYSSFFRGLDNGTLANACLQTQPWSLPWGRVTGSAGAESSWCPVSTRHVRFFGFQDNQPRASLVRAALLTGAALRGFPRFFVAEHLHDAMRCLDVP